MPRRRKPSEEVAAPPAQGAALYAPTLNAGFQATASRVQEMHNAISHQTFDTLLRVPGMAMPTRIVQSVHDAITHGVYAAVRHGGGAAMALAGEAERLATDPLRTPSQREQAARSALNGAFGDALLDSGSGLAIRMGLHADGAPLAVTAEAMRTLHPRVCVFVHGLACDEHSWDMRGEPGVELGGPPSQSFGSRLAQEFGVSAVQLRYNTGLAIDNNAQQLADLLAQAASVAPQVREWLLIGHSMGGLVARRAHALASAAGQAWAGRCKMIVCLGSPSQGAPLAQLGTLAATALNATSVTEPLGRLADARSQGIKDLRRGLKQRPHTAPALRLLFGTLDDNANSWAAKLLGDGLVLPGSASDKGLAGDVERVELPGLGHMAMLHDARVYALLRRWIGGVSDVRRGAPRG